MIDMLMRLRILLSPPPLSETRTSLGCVNNNPTNACSSNCIRDRSC